MEYSTLLYWLLIVAACASPCFVYWLQAYRWRANARDMWSMSKYLWLGWLMASFAVPPQHRPEFHIMFGPWIALVVVSWTLGSLYYYNRATPLTWRLPYQ